MPWDAAGKSLIFADSQEVYLAWIIIIMPRGLSFVLGNGSLNVASAG